MLTRGSCTSVQCVRAFVGARAVSSSAPRCSPVPSPSRHAPSPTPKASAQAQLSRPLTSTNDEMTAFLRRQSDHIAILPTPLPPSSRHGRYSFQLPFSPYANPYESPFTLVDVDTTSTDINDYWYTDSATQDLLAVMNACLHNLYDVRRAKGIFDRMRERHNNPLLDTRIYNAVLEAYLGMVSIRDDPVIKAYWLACAWDLFDTMVQSKTTSDSSSSQAVGLGLLSNDSRIAPSSATYANMFLAWMRFNPVDGSLAKVDLDDPRLLKTPADLLNLLLDAKIDVTTVIASRVVPTSEEAVSLMRLIGKAAVETGHKHVIYQLGNAEAVGLHGDVVGVDARVDVPEVRPVTVRVKKVKGASLETNRQLKSVINDPTNHNVALPGPVEVVEEDVEDAQEVPFNLANLRSHLADVVYAKKVLPDDLYQRQRLLEESVYDVALARLEHQGKTMKALNLQPKLMGDQLQHWMWSWHCALRDKLREVLKDIEELEKATSLAARRNKQPSYFDSRANKSDVALLGPYLRLLKEDRLSLLTIMEVMRLNGTSGICGGMKTTRALVSVGKAVEMEYKSQMCQNNRIAIPVGVTGGTQGSGYFSYMGYRSLQERRVAACRMAEDSEGWTTDWTQVTRAKVGGVLVDCLISTARVVRQGVDKDGAPIEEEQEAFFHTYEYQCGMKLGVIKLNQIIADALASNSVGESIHPRHLPMLVPPKPWTDYRHGGYLHNKTFAMRFKDSREQESYLRRASAKGSLELVYASLDYLGRTPWVINKKVFDVVLKVWNSGIRLGKMPPAEYEEPEPEKPTVDLSAPLKALQQQERNYKLKYKSWQQAVAENHSNRCSVNYKIEIARAFLGDKMYFPHNLDFRGRAYPIPPHLNHIGDDLSRGLLKFHEKKPLGERGLRWLKVHLANLYGYDKASFSERVRFVEDSLDLIYDSATNPLDGKRWWMDASDPWQCLAVCMELRDALESPDPLTFESGQPVHQDGTCNGLQHYAALGGDNQGARQVNLSAADRPSDVYTHVGNMVEKIIDADAAKGDPIAVMLQGKITRKVVKQTVMTTVYGVTFVGAREQISKQLRDRKDIPEEDCWAASAYLAKLVLGCIGNLFSGAKDIMTWLSLSARLIAKSIPETRLAEALADFKVEKEKAMMTATSLARKPAVLPRGFLQKEFMTPVVWTTPMGLPIVQPYRKMTKRQIITPIQTVYLIDPNVTNRVNSTKQASAFPPNFIHSLDATHMMLTALRCNSANLTFASVHDSYWTHACDIDHMSEIIRDTFIALHSADVLERLRREFIIRYSKHKIPLIAFSKGTSIVKALVDAGSRLRVTRAQAESLKGLAPLLEISDDMPSTVDEADADLLRDAVDSMETNDSAAVKSKSKSKLGSISHDDDDPLQADELEEDGDTSGSDPNLLGKFVNLADILPPLPKKGTFHVEEIKESPYFFS